LELNPVLATDAYSQGGYSVLPCSSGAVQQVLKQAVYSKAAILGLLALGARSNET
jgi:hypothetical protein